MGGQGSRDGIHRRQRPAQYFSCKVGSCRTTRPLPCRMWRTMRSLGNPAASLIPAPRSPTLNATTVPKNSAPAVPPAPQLQAHAGRFGKATATPALAAMASSLDSCTTTPRPWLMRLMMRLVEKLNDRCRTRTVFLNLCRFIYVGDVLLHRVFRFSLPLHFQPLPTFAVTCMRSSSRLRRSAEWRSTTI